MYAEILVRSKFMSIPRFGEFLKSSSQPCDEPLVDLFDSGGPASASSWPTFRCFVVCFRHPVNDSYVREPSMFAVAKRLDRFLMLNTSRKLSCHISYAVFCLKKKIQSRREHVFRHPFEN